MIARNLAPLLILVSIFTVFSIEYARAQVGSGLIVTPKRITFDSNERTKEILLANRGDKAARYRITVINRAMDETGSLVPTDAPAAGESFADKFVRFGPRQVTLEPKQSQKVRILSRLPATAPDGEYRSHVLIQAIPEAAPAENAGGGEDTGQLGINVRAVFGVSLPVILRKGDLEANVEIKDAKLSKVDGKTYLDIDLERSGNKSVFGTLKIFTGSTEIGILKNVAIYLSTPVRQVSVRIDDKYANELSGKPIKVTFGAVEANEDAPEAERTFTSL